MCWQILPMYYIKFHIYVYFILCLWKFPVHFSKFAKELLITIRLLPCQNVFVYLFALNMIAHRLTINDRRLVISALVSEGALYRRKMLFTGGRCSLQEEDALYRRKMLFTGGRCSLQEEDALYRRKMLFNRRNVLFTGGRCSLQEEDALYRRKMLFTGGRCSLQEEDALYRRKMLFTGGRCSLQEEDALYRRKMLFNRRNVLFTGGRCSLQEDDALYRRKMLFTGGRCSLQEEDALYKHSRYFSRTLDHAPHYDTNIVRENAYGFGFRARWLISTLVSESSTRHSSSGWMQTRVLRSTHLALRPMSYAYSLGRNDRRIISIIIMQ